MKSEVQHLRLPIREATTCACTVGSRSLWLLVLVDLFDLCRLEESHLTAAVLQSLRSCAAARARRCRCRRSPCRGCAAGHADRATATWVSHGRVGRLDAHRRKALERWPFERNTNLALGAHRERDEAPHRGSALPPRHRHNCCCGSHIPPDQHGNAHAGHERLPPIIGCGCC